MVQLRAAEHLHVLTRRGHRVAPRRDRTAPLYARIEQDAAIPAMIVIVAPFQSPIGLAACPPALRQLLDNVCELTPLRRCRPRPDLPGARNQPLHREPSNVFIRPGRPGRPARSTGRSLMPACPAVLTPSPS